MINLGETGLPPEEEMLALLAEANAIIKGSHIVYTPKEYPKGSGQKRWFHGKDYVNKDALFLNPQATMQVCKALADGLWGEADAQVIAAPAVGAVILSFLTAFHYTPQPSESIERVIPVYAELDDTGKMVFKRGYAKEIPGKRVAVVEDVLSSGGSARRVVDAVRELDGEVTAVAAICNRGGVTAADLGDVSYFFSLINVDMPMSLDEDCQQCKDGVPIDKRVGKWKEFLIEKAQGEDEFAGWCRSQL